MSVSKTSKWSLNVPSLYHTPWQTEYEENWEIIDGALGKVLATSDEPLSNAAFLEDKINTNIFEITATYLLNIKDSGITTSKIADSAITTDKIANSAVTSAKIADSAVIETKVADAAITTEKIADSAVTNPKIADSAITNSKIALNQITSDRLEDPGNLKLLFSDDVSGISWRDIWTFKLYSPNYTYEYAYYDTNVFKIHAYSGIPFEVEDAEVKVNYESDNSVKFKVYGDSGVGINRTTLYADGATGKVGIGYDAPWELLHVGHSETNDAADRHCMTLGQGGWSDPAYASKSNGANGDKIILFYDNLVKACLGFDASNSVWLQLTGPSNETCFKIYKGADATADPVLIARIADDHLRIVNSMTPGASGDAGTISWQSDKINVCVATDTWKYAPLTSDGLIRNAEVASDAAIAWSKVSKTGSNLTDLDTRSHADLQNLTADDHSQYALLNGRSGGQILYGGTASGDDIEIHSTSNATKGTIDLGGFFKIDEENNKIGIGTDPANSFQVYNYNALTLSGDSSSALTLLGNTFYVSPSGYTQSGRLQSYGTSLLVRNNGTVSEMRGFSITIGNYGAGGADPEATITTLYGNKVSIMNKDLSTITNCYGYYVSWTNTGTYGTVEGLHIGESSVAATNKRGIYIGAISGGTSENYAIYAAGGDVYIADNIGIGVADAKAQIHGTGSTIVGADTGAVADGDLGAGQVNIWVDEAGNSLKFKVKYSDGTTIKTGSIALS